MKIRTKIIGMGLLLVLLTAVSIVSIAYFQENDLKKDLLAEMRQLAINEAKMAAQNVYLMSQAMQESLEKSKRDNLQVAHDILEQAGTVSFANENITWTAVNQYSLEKKSITLPKMIIGERWLGQNRAFSIRTPVVDKVKDLVGGTCTIFQRMNIQGDMLRVATNVEKSDGSRAIGTYIPRTNPDGTPNPVISTVLKGKPFYGRAYVVNDWYITAYEPIWGKGRQEVVGILYVGKKQENFASLRQSIMKMQIGKTGYIGIVGGKGNQKGIYLISKNGERDGEDILDARDAAGHLIVRDIIEKANALKFDERSSAIPVAVLRYSWQNPGEERPRSKTAAVTYFAPWDWVIVAGFYEDDFEDSQLRTAAALSEMMGDISAVALVIIFMSLLIGVFVARGISRPLERAVEHFQRVGRGNLDLRLRIGGSEEITQLACAFDDMVENLKSVTASRDELDHEITVRKLAQEALQAALRQLQDIIEFLPDATFVIDQEKRVIAWNRAIEEMTGVQKEDILGEGDYAYARAFYSSRRPILIDLLDNPDPVIEAKYDSFQRQGRFICAEGFVPGARNGNGAYFSGKASFLLDQHGNRVGAIESLRDITEKKQAEEDLKAAHQRLQDIIEFLPDATFVIDHEKKVVAWNRALEEMTGIPKKEMIGKGENSYSIPFYGERRPVLLDMIDSPEIEKKGLYDVMGNQGETMFVEQHLPSVYGGKGAYVWATASRLFDQHGNFVGAIESIRDISDRKEAREKLETANRELEAFVYTVSHDLRSPLTPILGFAEALSNNYRESLDEVALSALEAIYNQGLRMLHLMEDLLAFAKVGQVERPAEPLDAKKVVDGVVRGMAAQLSQADVKVEVGKLPSLRVPETLLVQVFDNLIGNAIKYGCKAGGVIEVDGSRDGDMVRFYVRDHGVGIQPEDCSRIFEVFYRGKTGKDKKGTGIGLATVQKIAKHFNGRAWVEETPGGGSTFWVEIVDAYPTNKGN